MSTPRSLLLFGAAMVLASSPQALAEADSPPVAGTYHYRWDLGGFAGAVAGLFFPDRGDGVLSFLPGEDGEIVSQLEITAEKTDDGEHFTYGSRLDAATGHSREAWSSYKWRGKSKSKRAEIAQSSVVDIVAGIYAIRLDPPAEARRLEVWSDGKLYPVEVVPRGKGRRNVGGREVEARHFTIRGLRLPDRRRWKGKVDLWLADDDEATPIEIRISRKFVSVRLRLRVAV